MKYTFISVPALGDKQNTFLNIKGKLTEYAQIYKFTIPEFKVSKCKKKEEDETRKNSCVHSVDWHFGRSSSFIRRPC